MGSHAHQSASPTIITRVHGRNLPGPLSRICKKITMRNIIVMSTFYNARHKASMRTMRPLLAWVHLPLVPAAP